MINSDSVLSKAELQMLTPSAAQLKPLKPFTLSTDLYSIGISIPEAIFISIVDNGHET